MHGALEIGVWAIAAVLLVSIFVKIKEDKKAREERDDDRAEDRADAANDRKENDVQQ